MRTLSEGTKNYLEFYMPIACSNGSCGDSDLDGQTMERGVKASFNSDETGAGVTSVPIFSFDQSSGKVSMTNTKYNFAYNKDYFYKQKEGGTAQCMDRNSYNQMAFRYGLYDSNGSRVKLNSGFPIKATVSGTEYDGYIGYYGVWMQGQTLTSDTTVTKLDYSDPTASGTDYTLKVYNGKLFKHTKQDVTLDNIKNIPLDWYDMSDSTQKRVVWNGTNLVSDAKRDPANNYQWANYETPEVITLTASNAPYGFYFYSRALGGDGQIKLTYASFGGDPSAPTGTTNVIFHTRAPVFVGDTVPSNLTCYERCPNASRLATGSSSSSGGSSSVYETAVWSDNLTAGLVGSNGGYKYTFSTSSSEMVLKDSSSTSVALTSKNDNLSYGLRSGILFDNSSANYQALLCPWDSDDTASSGDTICPWRAREALSEFYTWESGTDDWQKTTLLIDSSGDALKFDSPISVKYAHPSTSTSSNSGKNYAGTNFFLEYGGFGNLWGIPSFCVDSSTGKKTNCASSGTRWVEEFVIAAGANASKASDSSVEYVIKPLEVEQSMKEADASKCTDAGLTLGDDTVPDISNFTDPKIGDKPSVTGPPAILDGNKTGS